MRRGWLHTLPRAQMALRGYRPKEVEMRRGWLHTPPRARMGNARLWTEGDGYEAWLAAHAAPQHAWHCEAID